MTEHDELVVEEKNRTTVGRAVPAAEALPALAAALSSGSVEVVDLTQPLSENTPIIQLPEPFVNTPGWTMHELSRYDDRGPAWYWNSFEGGEHVGTHLDAPVHWVTGKDSDDVSQIPLERLIGPAVVLDKVAEAQADPDYLLTVDEIRAFEAEHGPLPDGSWLLYRTGWDARAQDQERFLNANETGPHTPGIDVDCARWLAEEAPIVGVGVETVGTDAGAAHSFDPPFPCHQFLLGAGKYGLTQLANLDRLPPTGALLIVAPLKLVNGSGSPCRAMALVPSNP
jgi:kynurenine formamidase